MMPEDLAKKNVEMWEQFTSSYMDTMFKAMERTMEQSQAFKEKMDEAVQASVSSQMEMTLATLQALQRQVEMLNAKVDELMKQGKG